MKSSNTSQHKVCKFYEINSNLQNNSFDVVSDLNMLIQR